MSLTLSRSKKGTVAPPPASTDQFQQTKTLPHLPKGVHIPKLNDYSKPLPADTQDGGNNALMVPGQQGGGRRERQQRQYGVEEAPPVFAAHSKALPSLSIMRSTKAQKQMYAQTGGIEPIDLLTDRLSVWQKALKDLLKMFKNIAAVERSSSSGYSDASTPLTVPFPSSNHQFLQYGGVQDVWTAYRDYTVERSMVHHDYVNFLKGSIIPSLRNLKEDLKEFVHSVKKDPNLRSSVLYDSRVHADRVTQKLDNSVRSVLHSPDELTPQDDPTLLNLATIQAHKSLFKDENTLQENVRQLQREVATVEQRLMGSLQVITKNWENYCVEHNVDEKELVGKVSEAIEAIEPNADWNEFVRRNLFQLVNEKAAFKTDDDISYRNQGSPMCMPIKVNFLNRKKMMGGWTEGLYVLTPCGYMHGYKSAKHFETQPLNPELSLFLPASTVSSTDEQAEDFSFLVTTGGKRNKINMEKKFLFQANDANDLASWYQETTSMTGRNTGHEVLDLENVPPALPGLQHDEQRLLTNEPATLDNQPADDHAAADQYVPDASAAAPLGTASVLPSDMPSTSSAPDAAGLQARDDEAAAPAADQGVLTPSATADDKIQVTTQDILNGSVPATDDNAEPLAFGDTVPSSKKAAGKKKK
ncbi:hypothetical protein BC940DRAFT_368209 [Gongronella butleri]|nr:hypothetical protein BC940DRAFT_368209 [Gongronella butleri]